jgi:hypothetical protein
LPVKAKNEAIGTADLGAVENVSPFELDRPKLGPQSQGLADDRQDYNESTQTSVFIVETLQKPGETNLINRHCLNQVFRLQRRS